MKDSKKKSTSEVLTNMAISLPIDYLANFAILPQYAEAIHEAGGDIGVQAVVYLHLAIWFSLVSFVRQYLLRRLYNLYGPDETSYSILMRGIRRIRNG